MAKSTNFFLFSLPLFIKPRREGREGLRSTNAINPPDVLETREPRFIKVYIPFTREIKNIRFFRITGSYILYFLDGDEEEEMTIINNKVVKFVKEKKDDKQEGCENRVGILERTVKFHFLHEIPFLRSDALARYFYAMRSNRTSKLVTTDALRGKLNFG